MQDLMGFEIIIASLPDHDRVVAEIYVGQKYVALISQEDKDGAFKLEIPGPGLMESEILREVNLPILLRAIAVACDRLQNGD